MTSTHGLIALMLRQYDKIIAMVAVVVLGVAVGALALSKGTTAAEEENYARKLDSIPQANPTSEPIATTTYSNSLDRLTRPFSITLTVPDSAVFFVPEARVWCANNECRVLIPQASTNCPTCRTPQPIEPEDDPNLDSDGDGTPDWWELKHGLNPLDAADARIDSDGDGFDNHTEFMAKTDPLDPKDHPDLIDVTRVEGIEATRLPIRFMGATRMPNGRYRCQINVWLGDGVQPSTYFVTEGEAIGSTSYKLLRYFETTEERFDPMANRVRNFSLKKVEIGRGSKKSVLGLDEDAVEADYVITLILTHTGKRLQVTGDGAVTIGNKTYRVISVDNQATTIVLRDDADKKDIAVPRL